LVSAIIPPYRSCFIHPDHRPSLFIPAKDQFFIGKEIKQEWNKIPAKVVPIDE
jgi:hypothetical protein